MGIRESGSTIIIIMLINLTIKISSGSNIILLNDSSNDDNDVLQRMDGGDWECESQLGSGGFGIVHVWRNKRFVWRNKSSCLEK